jgi:hypothetical protein
MDICRNGGYAAILDMNEELALELVKEIGGDRTKFFETNVLETESIAAAVKGALEWVKETGKEVGGVIAAAGVSTPAKVCLFFLEYMHLIFDLGQMGVVFRFEQALLSSQSYYQLSST